MSPGHLLKMNKRGIRFHVRHNDYFETIATRLDFAVAGDSPEWLLGKELAEVRDEMIYMQQNDLIIKDQPGI